MSCIILILIVTAQSTSQGQVPSIPKEDNLKTLISQPSNLSGQIGNLAYAPVRLDGRPVLLIAAPLSIDTEKGDNGLSPLKIRVQRIENKLSEIVDRGFEPETLQVTTAILNNQVVIQVFDGKMLKPQTLATITELDAQLYGQSISDISSMATQELRQSLIRASNERQPEYIKSQMILSAQVLLATILVTIVLGKCESIINQHLNFLKAYLLKLNQENLSQQTTEKIEIDNYSYIRKLYQQIPERLKIFWLAIYAFLKRNKYDSTVNFSQIISEPTKFINSQQRKSIWEKRIKINIFIRRLILFALILLWVRVIAFILVLFPNTRELGVYLSNKPITILMLWAGIILALRIGDLLIHWIIQGWIDEISLIDNSCQRQLLRITTFRKVLEGFIFAIFIAVGIIVSLSIFQIPVATVLAGAGILGFAISFGSQNLIKDLISGMINLFNDSYAVGDFVVLGDVSGKVEDLNLFVTRIRSLNGDLITMPNGTITMVRNQSKDWSRVDYKVIISYEDDVERAMTVLSSVAQQLCDDPQWHHLIIEEPNLMGVEDLSYQGITLRLLLKTLPGEQWRVGRELRLRLKQAFDLEGINIGIPKQSLLVQNPPDLKTVNPFSGDHQSTIDQSD